MNNLKTIKKISIIYIVLCFIENLYFIYNYEFGSAIAFGLAEVFFILMLYSYLKRIKKSSPQKLEDNNFVLTTFIMPLIFVIIGTLFISSLLIDKRSFQVGDIHIKFPRQNNYIFGDKDNTGNYYYIDYYYKNCSIEVNTGIYDSNLSNLDNIKANVQLDHKITKELTKEEFYKLDFKNNKEDINGKEWESYEIELPDIYYKVYTRSNNSNFYFIETKYYKNADKKTCENKVSETFKTIKYN